MEFLYQILLILIPSGLVFLSSWLLINRFIKREQHLFLLEQKLKQQQQMNPMKIQAYERLIVLCERMNPGAMVLRNASKVAGAKELQIKMIEELKSEVEHNISQQLFVGNEAWRSVVQAKEELIQLIQISSQKVAPTASAMELSTIVLQILDNLEVKPHERPLSLLKAEFQQKFAN